MPTAFWRTRERGENDFREFFPHESRCCSNPGVHKLYPFSNITRPVRESCNFAPRVRVERNVTIEAESFSGQTYIFKYFPLTLLRFLISSIIMNARFSLYQQSGGTRARPFSQVQKNPWELFLSCAVRCVNQERPKVIFRHDDRISCISPLLFFPSSCYSFHAENSLPIPFSFPVILSH